MKNICLVTRRGIYSAAYIQGFGVMRSSSFQHLKESHMFTICLGQYFLQEL